MTICVTHPTGKCGTRPTEGVHNLSPCIATPTRKTTTKQFLFNLITPPLHILKLKHNICAVCACVWRDFGPHTHANTGQTQQTRGCWLGKRTQKVIPRTKSPQFGLQHPPTCPLSIPPPNHPNFTLCAPQQRCTPHQDNHKIDND